MYTERGRNREEKKRKRERKYGRIGGWRVGFRGDGEEGKSHGAGAVITRPSPFLFKCSPRVCLDRRWTCTHSLSLSLSLSLCLAFSRSLYLPHRWAFIFHLASLFLSCSPTREKLKELCHVVPREGE